MSAAPQLVRSPETLRQPPARTRQACVLLIQRWLDKFRPRRDYSSLSKNHGYKGEEPLAWRNAKRDNLLE